MTLSKLVISLVIEIGKRVAESRFSVVLDLSTAQHTNANLELLVRCIALSFHQHQHDKYQSSAARQKAPKRFLGTFPDYFFYNKHGKVKYIQEDILRKFLKINCLSVADASVA